MPGLFSAADSIWQYKFGANSSRYACASSILLDSFDILRALHHLIWPILAGISQIQARMMIWRGLSSVNRDCSLTLFAAEAASACL